MVLTPYSSNLSPLDHFRSHKRRYLWLILTILSIFVSTVCVAAHLQPTEASPAIGAINTAQAQHSAPGSSSVASTPTYTVPVPSAVNTASVPICTPDTSYSSPSAINLSDQSSGLDQVIDPTSFYQIHGNDSVQIQSQVKRCAPAFGREESDYAAETSYNLTWQYSYTPDNSGVCSLNNVSVGLHVNMVLPQWQPATPNTGLAEAWKTYIANLTTHENGHVALDQQYANQLLSDLREFPATECGSVSSAVEAKAKADISALNAANDAYDAQTNHGATQGAILP